MSEMINIALSYLKKKIGMTNIFLLAFFCLGIYATTLAKDFIVTPIQVEQKVQRVGDQMQVQIYELQIQGLTNEMYQLKKLKSKKMADDDDIDRLQEVKRELDSLKAKKDSLQIKLIK